MSNRYLRSYFSGLAATEANSDAALANARILDVIVTFGVLLPGLAVGAPRPHGADRGGRWGFITMVPLVGPIPLIVWLATAGTPGANRFGAAAAARAA